MLGQREEERLLPWELSHDFSAQWLCADSAVFSPSLSPSYIQDTAFGWRGPLTTKVRGAKGKVSIQGTCQDVLGMFWGFYLNYKESAGCSYTQAKKQLWKPDQVNLVWPDEVYLNA